MSLGSDRTRDDPDISRDGIGHGVFGSRKYRDRVGQSLMADPTRPIANPGSPLRVPSLPNTVWPKLLEHNKTTMRQGNGPGVKEHSQSSPHGVSKDTSNSALGIYPSFVLILYVRKCVLLTKESGK